MKKNKGMSRRSFLKRSSLGAVGTGTLLASSPLISKEPTKSSFTKIKSYRKLGRTGFKASDIGIGTSRAYPVTVMKALLDAGVNLY